MEQEEPYGKEVVVRTEQLPGELTVQQVLQQVEKIQMIMKQAMKDGEHYGVIPGTDKPTLLKPGAEKLCLTFRFDPEYETKEIMDGPHLTVVSKCTLYHIPSGLRMGSGMGSCSTKESRYAYRNANRKCPQCGKEAIIKGKAEYGGGWLCFAKKDGCGAKFKDGDRTIESQTVGRVPNENIADQYNTILKMATKRSLVAVVLNVTAASDIFTQDMEDLQDKINEEPAKSETTKPERKDPVAPSPASPPKTTEDDLPNPIRGVVENVSSRAGKTGNQPWTKYGIQVDGKWFGTFDRGIYEFCGELKELDKEVWLLWTTDGKFRNIESVEPVEETGAHDYDPGPVERAETDAESPATFWKE